MNECHGSYSSPGINPKYPNGLIEISDKITDDKIAAATLAHEYRHHWQLWQLGRDGLQDSGTWFFSNLNKYEDYNDLLKAYFTTFPCEADALKYEIKVMPDTVWTEIYHSIFKNDKR